MESWLNWLSAGGDEEVGVVDDRELVGWIDGRR
jgi:hypothetical protein